MDLDQRIAQFENMAQADPENDMAHFSLGGAYAQAGRHAEAAEALLRCVELNPDMSKAYQLAGESLVEAGDEARASDVLTKGYVAAAALGDRMPMRAMGELLEKLGVPLPETSAAEAQAQAPASGSFVCKRTGRPGAQLDSPPFRGPVGQWIMENISAETWTAWIGQGTKVINELRLDLSRDADSEAYDQHMREFLGIDDALHAQLHTQMRGDAAQGSPA